MIKKLVTLGVGFVFAFVAIFFSVRSVDVVAEGKGSGKDATVENPKEFGTVLETLPEVEYYEALMEAEQLKNLENAGKSLAAAADTPTTATGKVRPVTVYEKSLLSQSSSSSSHSDDRRNDSKDYYYLRRTMYIYYTEDAVYYDSVGQIVVKKETEIGPNSEYTRTTTQTVTDFDAHMYIGKGGVFIKFNKWETTKTEVTGTVKSGIFTEAKKDDQEDVTSMASSVEKEVQKALKDHYGKWISIYGGRLSEMPDLDDTDEMPDFGGDFDPSTMDPSKYEDAYLSYLAMMACSEVSDAYYQQLVTTTANNNDTFAKFAGYLKGYNQPLAFEEKGNFYIMTDRAKEELLANYGWFDVNMNNGKPFVESSYFVIDMNDTKAPVFLTNIDYSLHASGSGSNSNLSYTLRDELGIKHLDNTVVPETPDTKDDMYTLFGDAVKKIMKTLMNDDNKTALLIDGLNAATEVIGR